MAEETTYKRLSNGDFAIGNKGGPGRPKSAYKETIQNLKIRADMLDEALVLLQKRWPELVQAMIDHAIGGSVPAANWLRDMAIGRPKECVEIDTTKSTIKLLYNLDKPKDDE